MDRRASYRSGGKAMWYIIGPPQVGVETTTLHDWSSPSVSPLPSGGVGGPHGVVVVVGQWGLKAVVFSNSHLMGSLPETLPGKPGSDPTAEQATPLQTHRKREQTDKEPLWWSVSSEGGDERCHRVRTNLCPLQTESPPPPWKGTQSITEEHTKG